MSKSSVSHFTLPEEIDALAREVIANWQSETIGSLTERLSEIGVDPRFAYHIEIDTYIRGAAMLGILHCYATEGREPDRDLWLQATAEAFDEAKRHAAENFSEFRRSPSSAGAP